MSINEMISEYQSVKAEKKAAEKREKELAEMIKKQAGTAGTISTNDYTVIIDVRTRNGLNTEELYRDFPDIKKDYGTVSEYTVVIVKEKRKASAAA